MQTQEKIKDSIRKKLIEKGTFTNPNLDTLRSTLLTDISESVEEYMQEEVLESFRQQ